MQEDPLSSKLSCLRKFNWQWPKSASDFATADRSDLKLVQLVRSSSDKNYGYPRRQVPAFGKVVVVT
jgi:hypothetical protein